MATSCKLYTNSQWMKFDMMLNHHLQLDVACDIFNATNWLQITIANWKFSPNELQCH
jgi:hypothetical protein